MTTLLVVRLEHPPAGGCLAIRGYRVEQGDGAWSETPGAEDLLPREQPFLEQACTAVLPSAERSAAPAETGRRLWDLVMGGEVGKWWQAQVDAAGVDTVRTVLDVRIPELRPVPWELMSADRGVPTFRSERRPWVRAGTPWQPVDPIPVPVRVLVVASEPPEDDLQADAELAAIHGALREVPGRWLVEVLQSPSSDQLWKSVKDLQPEILHVIGHGAEKQGERVLKMFHGSQQWALERSDVGDLPAPLPRLVILNACRTGAAAVGRDASWSFADEFFAAGSAAVLVMQGDIPSVAAVAFSGTFYRELASGTAVDIAASLARITIKNALKAENDETCWAMPCLSVVADPDHVLPVRIAPRDELLLVRSPYRERFASVSTFVDRSTERRLLWRALEPQLPAARGLLLVTGDPGVGKSGVVLSALLTMRLRGRNVVHVDLSELGDDERRSSWLTVLRGVRDAAWEWLPDLPREHRERFDHDLAFLRQHQDPLPWVRGQGRPDDGLEFPSVGDVYDTWIARIFVAFRHLLSAVAEQEPLLLVLDGLRHVEDVDVSTWLSRELVEPVGRGLPGLQLVVVGTPDELARLSRGAHRVAGPPLRIPPFRKAELPRLAQEFYARLGVSLEGERWWPHMKELIKMADDWPAYRFADELYRYHLYAGR